MPSHRKPLTPSERAQRDAQARGRTRSIEAGHGAPRLPNERDESADSQAAGDASGRRVGEQAYADLQRGLVDTDRAPVADEVYRGLKQPPHGKPKRAR
jgi:hypothetical protein